MKSLILLLTVVFSTSAFAVAHNCGGGGVGSQTAGCSASGNLVISGIVQSSCALTITPEAKATALNLTAGETNAKVATVSEQSNNPSGYTISVRSANNGALKNASLAQSDAGVPYVLSYDGSAAAAATTTNAVVKTVNSLVGMVQDASDVTISFAGNATLSPGVYSDTLAFTMTAL